MEDGGLHRRLLTLDAHLDTPVHVTREGWDFGARHDHASEMARVDLARMDTAAAAACPAWRTYRR